MPTRHWLHTCTNGREVREGTPVCRQCGEKGEFLGWFYSMHEGMARYQTTYGLKPLGPHHRMASELFEGTRRACEACDGWGLQETNGGEGWRKCSACDGVGRFFTITPEEFRERRDRVLEAYPDAAAAQAQMIPDGAVFYNLSTGTVEAYPPLPDEEDSGEK